MTFIGRGKSALYSTAILILSPVLATVAQAQVRTPFKDIPPSDPKREVIQAVLNSSFYSMRGQFSSQEWTTGHYGGAWERARQYFPNHTFFVQPGAYFMTHGFSADGKLYMEVHESAYLNLSLENRRTFTDRSVVAEYARMRGAADGREAAAFAEKMGRLEPYFRDDAAKKRLSGMLGDKLYDRLLRELRDENYHMFAGALLHEGMHAKMDDDQLVAQIQADYRACSLPVQWDELRAHMAEMNYHKRYYNWAVGDLWASWKNIENLLKELEALRQKPKPLSQADKDRLEAIKAKIKAYIALIRLRMREMWQSAQRMQGLMASLQKDYIKPNPPADVDRLTRKLILDITDFVAKVGQAIQQMELALRALEANLDLWNEWAACKRPFPPPKPDIDKIVETVRRLKWPTAPGVEIDDLKDKADKEIAKVPRTGARGPGRRGGRSGTPAGGGRGSSQGFIISAGGQLSWPSLAGLNAYLGYLNDTWTGDIPAFGGEAGFYAAAGWRFSTAVEAGVFVERLAASVRGTLQAVSSEYTSKHGLTVIGAYVSGRTPALAGPLRLLGRAGVGYGTATYTEDENGFVTRGSDHGVVWHAAAGVEVGLAGGLSLNILGGYRSADFDGFGVSFFMPGSPPVRLAFGGAFTQAGLSFRF